MRIAECIDVARFFDRKSEVHQALQKIARKLDGLGIPYAVSGGMALFFHGFHRFTDERATKDTKRYWVVAVDKLGQEGLPSAPVWHWRQFRSYYEPFTGEWHQ